jgi:hypothetical protein
MKAARAYLGVLGTMGLLTLSVVVLLLVGSGAAALDRPSDLDPGASPLERIVVEDDAWWTDRARTGGARGHRERPAGDGPAGGGPAEGGSGGITLVGGTERGIEGETEGGPPGGGPPGNPGADAGQRAGGGGHDDGGKGGGNTGGGLPAPVGDTVRGALDGVAPGLGRRGLLR